jgi:hypothetical protein
MPLPTLLFKATGEENSGDYGYGYFQGVGEELGKSSVLYLVKRQEAMHTVYSRMFQNLEMESGSYL